MQARIRPLSIVLMLGAAAPLGTAQLPSYSVRFVGDGTPSGINDLGQVSGNHAGRAWAADPDSAPVLLPLPAGATASRSRDINDLGWVVGNASGAGFGSRAVIWKPDGPGGWSIDIVPTPTDSDATAVNDIGDVVGWFVAGGSYTYNDTEGLVELFPLGVSAQPTDINNERVLIGRSFSGQGQSFDIDTGVVSDLGLPTDTGTNYMAVDLNGINDAGDICGRGVVATAQPDDDQAVRYDAADHAWTALNSPVPQAFAIDLDAQGNTLFAVGFSSPPLVRFEGQGTFDLNDLLLPAAQGWSAGLNQGGHISDSGLVVCTGGNSHTGESGVLVLTPDCGTFAYGLGLGGANAASLSSDYSAAIGTPLELAVGGFSADGVALYFVSGGQALIPGFLGGSLLIDLGSIGLVGAIPVSAGLGTASLPIPANPNLVGKSAFAQAFMPDGTPPLGWALTNGLEIAICP